MKILAADKLPQSMADSLSKKGHNCTINSSLTTEELPDFIKDYEVLVVRSTAVTADVLDSGDHLKLIVRAGAGTNTIDKKHASNKGIKVCNVPGANSIAVAELAMGLIISIDRNIPDNVFDLRKGVWNKKKYSSSKGIYGRNLGILGLGAIGLALAERASAFGMNVFGVAKTSRAKETQSRIKKTGIKLLDTREELLKKCDVVSIHLPSVKETKNIVNQDFLNHMKEGALLVNTSRGELVDEASLIKAMNEKGIRAALDVYADEPNAGDSEFKSAIAQHPNVYGTHHIGASTQQAQDAVAEGVIEVIEAFANGGLINCVNQEAF
tara:strand:+ start:9590 stop:10561 length:972 start_codon:yes stop_codon:yes gene_type:complete